MDPPPPDTQLLDLPRPLLARLASPRHLALADRCRLRLACADLRSACQPGGLLLSELELEEGALSLPAAAGCSRLHLSHVRLDAAACGFIAAHTALCARLRALHAAHAGEADAAGLAALLAACSSLSSLALEGDCRLQGRLVVAQQQRPAELAALALSRDSQLAPEQLADWLSAGGAPAWPRLRRLDLSGCTRLGASLAFLPLCPALTALALHSCYKVTNATLEAVARGCAGGCGPGAQGSGWPCLAEVDLAYTRVSDAGCRHLAAAFSSLRSLSLRGCNVGDDGLAHLLGLGLVALNIKHCHRVTEEGVAALAALPGLCSLAFGYTSMPEADAIAGCIARHFRGLTALDLLSSELSDAGLRALGALRSLASLKLWQAGATGAGLTQLAGQPAGRSLRQLTLYGLGGLQDLACLGGFSGLVDLQLGGLADLASVPHSLAQLGAAPLPQLTSLSLERIDCAMPACLRELLGRLRGLRALRVRGCGGASQEEIAQLAAGAAGGACRSSASVAWAPAGFADTDDEADGWQRLPPA